MICDLNGRINSRICELKTIRNERELDDSEELDALLSLNPDQDIAWYCNCLDTSVYFVKNEEVYRKYLAEEISEIEDNMGFSLR